jgi:predicted short-subunit dehydrogenase-like oxidoreductase (DUF2520 family)
MSSPIRNIALIGSGNVANFFAHVFHQKGFTITQIVSRNQESGKQLAASVNAKYAQEYNVELKCDLLIVAVNDDTIQSVIETLDLPETIVCHTAGSVSLEVLGKFPNRGIIYPLQSIKGVKPVSEVPLLIETSKHDTQRAIEQLLNTCGFLFKKADSEQRAKYHLAAVFANNFTNAILAASEKIVEANNLDVQFLKPLIRHTFENALQNSASHSQTGPAIRNDQVSMQKHISLLEGQDDLVEVYKTLSQFIASKK